MQQLILKKEIPSFKMEALLHFLKAWDIEVELESKPSNVKTKVAEITLMSEPALATDWLNPQEDAAWKDL
jgi:hypothetical protein